MKDTAAWGAQLVLRRFLSRNIPGMTRKTREKDFEGLVDCEKPHRRALALKDLLLREPENVVSFAELGKLRTHFGLTGKARFIHLISKYPSFFTFYKDNANVLWWGFSPQAQLLADQELSLRKTYEAVAVDKLRKLLMMSVERRISVPKLAQLRRDMGLPPDFHSRVIYAYPLYFRVVEEKYNNEDGPVLELTRWDPALAITSLETRAKATGEYNSAGEPLFKVCLSRAHRLSAKQLENIDKFQERPFISPYADSKDFNKNTVEFEKRQVAVLHEILSLSIEKKTVFDYLTHFRKEYRLPQSLLALVLRHPTIFYVSRKGGRFTIFLKEAYERGGLAEKNEWNKLKDQYKALLEVKTPKQANDGRLTMEAEDHTLSKQTASGEGLKDKNIGEVVVPLTHKEPEDSDFENLILLCRRIQTDLVRKPINLADGTIGVIAKSQEGVTERAERTHLGPNDESDDIETIEEGLSDDIDTSASNLLSSVESEDDLFRDTTDEVGEGESQNNFCSHNKK